MPTFICMLSWTDQGIRGVKDSPKRLQGARAAAQKLGVEIKQVFLTTGEFDLLAILEAADGDNVAKLIMMLGAQGNLRSRTVRGWPEADYMKLISELP